ncbi:protein kinase [Actinosynnema sp. NPDC050801]|uniref:serine/threonine-protein kinase n=1 Tax=unclassified Actinosynnema TaxID=2637065 RepID=UPI0033E9D44E
MSSSVSENVLADRYQLVEPIGTGGMAEVHRAWDTVLRRHVAIKLFQPGFDPAGAQRFDNEVRVLAGLSHPALVSVYDADTTGATPFVVLRLVEGSTLHDRLALGGPLPLDQARRLGARLADALAHVHAHGLVHRDVKPSNILLDHEGEAYLADFGLAHLTGATRLTRTDQLVGTAAYLAPEQVLGGEVDHPADVYALGLVLLECLTGRREYQGGDVEAAVARLHRPPVVPVDLPVDVRGLLAGMTSTAPEDRPTAHDCAQLLAAGLVPLEPAVEPSAGDATEELPPATRPSWKTFAASAGALLGAFAITMAAMSGEPPATSSPPASPTQEAAPQQPGSSDAPRDQAEPRFVGTQQTGGTTQAPATPRATSSTPAPAEAAVGDAPAPETGQVTTTAPVPTTTAPQTSIPPTTTTQSTQPSPDPNEPPSEPTEDDNADGT